MKKRMMLVGALMLMLWGLMGCGVSGKNESVDNEKSSVSVQFGEPDKEGTSISKDGENDMEVTSSSASETADDQNTGSGNEAEMVTNSTTEPETPWTYINQNGTTLETRMNTPKGYERIKASDNSLAGFLRTYPMKADGAEVLLYNGSPKGNQRAHAAIFALPIEAENLQQCADSVMRVYAEYCWHNGMADKLKFYFTNGFLTEYSKWRDGYRISVNGNDITWTASAAYDDSYETFVKYMRIVFVYAGTLSMDTYESKPISPDEIQVGDVFLQGGSPGHVVMVVDICTDAQGRKAFLLGQGYMPAQEFHVINNPAHPDDPWYYEDEVTYPFVTAEYTFREGSLQRLSYLDWSVAD